MTYSDQLRRDVLELLLELGVEKITLVAKHFQVGISTVYRWYHDFQKTGVSTATHTRNRVSNHGLYIELIIDYLFQSP
jgi:transposase